MNLNDDHLSYGVMFLGLAFWGFIVIKSLRYWGQLKQGFDVSGMKWPLHSQEELNESARTNLPKFYKIALEDMFTAIKILFARSNNVNIQKPISGIRRLFAAFFLIPIMFTVVLVFVLTAVELW